MITYLTDKRLFLVFALVGLSLKALPAVFVVTSNADSGPGTFREALTLAAANGITEKDHIDFNFADVSEAGRTTIVLSLFPDVTANLVIDGSTQTGAVFGVSQAKVAFYFDSKGAPNFYGLRAINQKDIEIYGLYLKLTNLFTVSRTPSIDPKGLKITGTDNVQLGDIGKGNVIAGFYWPLSINDDNISSSNGCILKSNFLSIQADGYTVTKDYLPVFINVYGDIIVGGSVAERNVLAKGISIQQNSNSQVTNVLFANNYAGVNYDLTAAFVNATVQIGGGAITRQNIVATIADNVMSNGGQYESAIFITQVAGKITVVRNYIGTDRSKNKLGVLFRGIYIQRSEDVHIGSSDPADANYIGYCQAVSSESTEKLTFNKNSFFCTSLTFSEDHPHNGVYYFPVGSPPTQCDIVNITAGGVTGTATPNAEVELFYSDKCATCSPERYFASTTADANGNWAYTGTITAGVIASATLDRSTSEFTYPRIIKDNVKITNACGGKGSITGIATHGAFTVKWLDSKKQVVGTGNDLLDVKAGKYQFMIDNGGGCGDSVAYTIRSKLQLDSSKVVISKPACGDQSGAISGLVLTNSDKTTVTYAWTDAQGNIVGDSLSIKNLPSGTYKFVASGADSCTLTFGPVVLNDVHPQITANAPTVTTISSFTPNGDSVNDNWEIKNISYYPDASIQIFNRYGQRVYNSKGYAVPFNGMYRGSRLPAGVYYYVINYLGTGCKLLSGSITLLR